MGERMYVYGRNAGEDWVFDDTEHCICLGKLNGYVDHEKILSNAFLAGVYSGMGHTCKDVLEEVVDVCEGWEYNGYGDIPFTLTREQMLVYLGYYEGDKRWNDCFRYSKEAQKEHRDWVMQFDEFLLQFGG